MLSMSRKEVPIVSTVLAILLVLGAGLFVGSHVNSAREAHVYYTTSWHRATKGFSAWVHNVIIATLGVVGLLVLLFVVLGQLPTG